MFAFQRYIFFILKGRKKVKTRNPHEFFFWRMKRKISYLFTKLLICKSFHAADEYRSEKIYLRTEKERSSTFDDARILIADEEQN